MGTNVHQFFGIFSIGVGAKMAIGLEGTNLLNDRYRRLLSKIFGKWGSFPTSLKVEKGTGTGKITNKEYQEVCDTSERTSSRDLADLVASGLFEQIGTTGKGTVYVLRRHKAPQRRQNNHENPSSLICIHGRP